MLLIYCNKFILYYAICFTTLGTNKQPLVYLLYFCGSKSKLLFIIEFSKFFLQHFYSWIYIVYLQTFIITLTRLYSVVVITFGFDPNNPGSNPGTTLFFNDYFFTFFPNTCNIIRLRGIT